MKRKQNGFVIELMIVFMVVSFGFCLVLITYLGSLGAERKYSKNVVDMQTELNQIGEYYLRSIEAGKGFPTGDEDDVSDFASADFSWMDDETKEFFLKSNEKYDYEAYFSIARAGIGDFFKDKYIMRKLVIRAETDGKVKMVIDLKETRITDNKADYEVHRWSVGDNIQIDESELTNYKPDDLTVLQKLWKFFGLEAKTISTLSIRDFGDVFDLLTETFGNWREAFN